MLSYAPRGSTNGNAPSPFCDTLLASAGIAAVFEDPSVEPDLRQGRPGRFRLVAPFDRLPATVGNGSMMAYLFDSPEAVISFYPQAIEPDAKDEGTLNFASVRHVS